MTDMIEGKFFCPDCHTQITWSDDATDETPIRCAPCDTTIGTYGELKDRFMEEAKSKVVEHLKSTFRRR